MAESKLYFFVEDLEKFGKKVVNGFGASDGIAVAGIGVIKKSMTAICKDDFDIGNVHVEVLS